MTEVEPEELGEIDQELSVQSRAVMVNQKGYVDTDVQFSEFFGSEHTVMAWVMPAFTYNNFGPIFAENGTGTYLVGQANFTENVGNGVDPLLFVQIGNSTTKRAYYNAPTYKKRQWNHIAVVRRPVVFGSYQFWLYVNGTRVTPIDGDVSFTTTETISGAPSGNLRFGRRTFKTSGRSFLTWQYYGFIDDAGVYTEALTGSEIQSAMSSPWGRSTLLAGWTFNQYDAEAFQMLNPKLKRPVVRQSPAYSVAVPSTRSSSDAGFFDGWLYVAPLQQSYRLPFRIGEVWKVTQSPDMVDNVSHLGTASFCYDFAKVGGSANAVVVAAAPGDIIHVEEDDVPPAGENEANNVKIETAPRELISYLHLAKGSYTSVFLDGDGQTDPQDGGPIPSIDVGDSLARVGPSANHLHFGARDGLGDETSTIPLAFTDYEVAPTSTGPWTPVVRGMPVRGQYVRRTD